MSITARIRVVKEPSTLKFVKLKTVQRLRDIEDCKQRLNTNTIQKKYDRKKDNKLGGTLNVILA